MNKIVYRKAEGFQFKHDYAVWTPSVKLTPEEFGKTVYGKDAVVCICEIDEMSSEGILYSAYEQYKASEEYTPINQINDAPTGDM